MSEAEKRLDIVSPSQTVRRTTVAEISDERLAGFIIAAEQIERHAIADALRAARAALSITETGGAK